MSESTVSRRLRGLNPAALTGVLTGESSPMPSIPGWEITGPLGEGGLGTVWKARRQADGTVAAVKVPRTGDISLIERLEVEATALRALDHPNIVRLLESGPLDDGSVFVAMEYVDGPALSQAIPAAGFPAAKVWQLFRQIGAAVAHAHSRGVLHRDLKPGNVLLDAAGNARVADFGLAHSVAGRVQRLSLTLTGIVAGTAEYLPPEAYRTGYEPDIATDVYALGVILHELLTGSPPRGAWRAVAQQRKDVDIRVDDLLHRALERDPAKRFPSVQTMLDELDRILRTPARYAGTPRVTRAVRFMDFLWTGLGLFLFLGATGVFIRIEKYGIGLPIDLIGTSTIRIGTYQSLLILVAAALPMGVWQLIRLWRFRKVPLRESLPAPFGVSLGNTRTAAAAVFLAQAFLFLVPGVLGAYSWKSKCSHWLQEGEGPWVQGLVVTAGYRGKTAHDPWAWPEKGKEYSLRERGGWITDPFGKDIDHTDFIPGLVPRIFAGLALTYASVMGLTAVAAMASWWRFGKWLRFAGFTAVAYPLGTGVAAVCRDVSKELTQSRISPAEMPAWHADAYTKRLSEVVHWLMPAAVPPAENGLPPAIRGYYADTVVFEEGVPGSGTGVDERLLRRRSECREQHLTAEIHGLAATNDGPPEHQRFVMKALCHVFTDPPGAPATCGLAILILNGDIAAGKGATITSQSLHTLPLYTAERRRLPDAEASAWVESLLGAFHPETARSVAARLQQRVFYQVELRFADGDVPVRANPFDALLGRMERASARGSRPVLLRRPTAAEALSGGRQRLTFDIEDGGQPSTWTAELIFTGGRWQCVKLSF